MWYGCERQQKKTNKGVSNHKCTQRRTHKYANMHFCTDCTNEYTNATASLPFLCGQEEHCRHIISECFSSQCDNMSAPVAVTTPHHIDIHQLCSSQGCNTTTPKIWHTKINSLYVYLPVHANVWACTPIFIFLFLQCMETTCNFPCNGSDIHLLTFKHSNLH